MLLDDEHLGFALFNVANSKDGLALLSHLIETSNCLCKGATFESEKDYYNKGFRDFGFMICEMMMKYAFDKYVELLNERRKNNE